MPEKAIQLYKEAGAETVLIGAPGGEGASTHAVGGARMGTDPATSVVDPYGVAHEVPNLVVMGGAVIPSRGAGAPTLTLQALAWRSAEHVVKNWRAIGRGSALRRRPGVRPRTSRLRRRTPTWNTSRFGGPTLYKTKPVDRFHDQPASTNLHRQRPVLRWSTSTVPCK